MQRHGACGGAGGKGLLKHTVVGLWSHTGVQGAENTPEVMLRQPTFLILTLPWLCSQKEGSCWLLSSKAKSGCGQ